MIYLDNAATTYPKPSQVKKAVIKAIERYGGNPGRSGHEMSLKAGMMVYETREKVAQLFGADAEDIIFTKNCTEALNIAIFGTVSEGSHVITTVHEHNSVLRPLYHLKKMGKIALTIISGEGEELILGLRSAINFATKTLVITAASNSFGIMPPIEQMLKIASKNNITTIVDMAQAAGTIEVDGGDILCMPGHKGLYGISGTGILVNRTKKQIRTHSYGGTGSLSAEVSMPKFTPDKLEVGTVNTIGIASLSAGIDFVLKRGIRSIYEEEIALVAQLYDKIVDVPGIKIYTERPRKGRSAPILTINHKDYHSEEFAQLLSDAGIATRGGLHCAPLAHRYAGTLDCGAVRFSPAVFTTKADIERVALSLLKIK